VIWTLQQRIACKSKELLSHKER